MCQRGSAQAAAPSLRLQQRRRRAKGSFPPRLPQHPGTSRRGGVDKENTPGPMILRVKSFTIVMISHRFPGTKRIHQFNRHGFLNGKLWVLAQPAIDITDMCALIRFQRLAIRE